MDDEQMLDWLNDQALRGAVYIEPIRDCGSDDLRSLKYRAGLRICLFTVASQHVYATNLWTAIAEAVRQANLRSQ